MYASRAAMILSVHPHACGEYPLPCWMMSLPVGSPPRLWGIPARLERGCQRYRFTPTPVGNTSLPSPRLCAPSVHPHACGEYETIAITELAQDGSPPRLWGIHQWRPWRSWGQRFTPTPVGNTDCERLHLSCWTVHPHACGEYDSERPLSDALCGSPPRLWGIRQTRSWPRRWRRFTPTPVGNTRPAL